MDVKEILSSLVSHDSVYGNERPLAEWTYLFLKKLDFEVEKIPVERGRFNIIAKRGNDTPLLCYGHLDTVPVYHGWNTDPFDLVENDDRLFGLGACDMKGGIAALLHAIQNLDRKVSVCLFLAVDEENESLGSWSLVNKHHDILKNFKYLLSAEPGASATRIGGSDVITLGRRGRARFVIKVDGYSAHGGHVDRGVSAISLANKIVGKIESQKPKNHSTLGDGTQYIAKISASAEGLSLPEYCEIEVERHLIIPETVESCVKEYEQIAKDVIKSAHIPKTISKNVTISVELKKRKNHYMEPYEIQTNSLIVEEASKAIKKLGKTPFVNYGRSVGDENVFANKTTMDCLIVGPEGANIHSPNEWVSYKSLLECSDLYKQLITAFSKSA